MKHLSEIKIEKKTETTNALLGGMAKETSKGFTKNGADTFTNSGSALLDFFAQAGSMRNNKEIALDLFKKAFSEDEQKAVRILFYLRDVRGGQGERDLFRTCLEYIGTDFPETFEKIISFIPEYGRYDDMFFDNAKVFEFLSNQIQYDGNRENPSLLAKWLPTINASSPSTRAKAHWMAEKFGVTPITYRKTVRDIRAKIKTVEALMSARQWGLIDYSKVPSQASRIYKNAFTSHDAVRYAGFIAQATAGEVKINASTLYPYQIYKSVESDYSPTLEALWNQLPDYTQGKNALVVADVSGSMSGDPMAVSVSLALYFAERNKGQFQNHFITFSSDPQLQKIQGKTLKQKMNSIESADWQMSTNLDSVFNLILNTAVQNNVAQDEMPSTIYIISDMEFNECVHGTAHVTIAKKYESAGYAIPTVVFWNVNGSGKNLPARKDDKNVALVSGFSPVNFKIAVENKTPEQVMNDVINSPRYEPIVL